MKQIINSEKFKKINLIILLALLVIYVALIISALVPTVNINKYNNPVLPGETVSPVTYTISFFALMFDSSSALMFTTFALSLIDIVLIVLSIMFRNNKYFNILTLCSYVLFLVVVIMMPFSVLDLRIATQ